MPTVLTVKNNTAGEPAVKVVVDAVLQAAAPQVSSPIESVSNSATREVPVKTLHPPAAGLGEGPISSKQISLRVFIFPCFTGALPLSNSFGARWMFFLGGTGGRRGWQYLEILTRTNSREHELIDEKRARITGLEGLRIRGLLSWW